MAVPLPGITTVFAPVAPAAAKSPLWLTVRFTVRFEGGAGLAVTVNCAPVPSVTGDVPGWMVTMGVVTPKVTLLSVGCGSAPPPTLVPRLVWSKPFASVPSGPRATVKVSLSASAVSDSVATCASAPSKRTCGVAVVAPDSVTPVFRVAPVSGSVPVFAARLQSSVVTPVPDTASGTSMISPAISARLNVTVKSTVPPSLTAPLPVWASETIVGSLSRRATVIWRGLPA